MISYNDDKITIKSYNITKIFIQFYFLNSYLLSYGVNICIVPIFKKNISKYYCC